MSVQNILDDNGKIDPAYIGAAASYGFVTNPLSAPLLCYNPTTLVNHPIIEASYVSGSSIKTDNLEQLPGSLQNRIRVDTNLQMATGRDLQFETNGVVTAVGNLDLTAGTGNIALTGGGTFSALMFLHLYFRSSASTCRLPNALSTSSNCTFQKKTSNSSTSTCFGLPHLSMKLH